MQENQDLTFDEEKHQYSFKGKPVPSVTEICGLLTSSKFTDINSSVLMRAQMRGTAVHELTEQIDYDCAPDEIDPELYPYVLAYQKFLKDYSPEWIASEKMLGCEMFAGTIDRVGIIDGHLVIVDLKTTSSMDRLSKISLCCQLYGYKTLLEHCKDEVVEFSKCFGVQLKKDGTYAIINVEECESKYSFQSSVVFVQALNLMKVIRGGK